MSDKLTDSEIVKALERCVNKLECFVFYNDGDGNSHEISIKDILGVISRLQAESERLFRDNQKYLSVMLWGNKKHVKNLLNKIKSEAYKECIEKVKEKSCKLNMCHNDVVVKTDYQISSENLDNLLKELVGEDK